MVQWLLSLPRTALVVLVLSAAILFIVAQDPPHTICRTQIKNFRTRQKGIIYKDPDSPLKEQLPLIDRLMATCKKGNTPGSCYGLFSKTKKLIHDFKAVSPACYSSLAQLSEVQTALFKIHSLMIRLAWGSGPDPDGYNKLNWLSVADIALFCAIKEEIKTLYGELNLLKAEQETWQKLPKADTMKPDQIKELSLSSQNCILHKLR